ncbi:hypothetical protein HYV89_04700 [Candidatus Woesearchaeota archaeon]|nr:hypothetical protein [Candidatus Woesearchaeota archaeon]
MFDEKRGQSTIFIIAGIVIVIAAVLVVFFMRENVQIGERITTAQIEPIKEYVEGCVKDELKENLENRREFGGRDIPDFAARKLQPDYPDYNVLNVPSNNLPSLLAIEREISIKIKSNLENVCTLERFRDNFNVEKKGDIGVRVNISDKLIEVDVSYPIVIEKANFKTEVKDFNVIYENKFGKIYGVVRDILNGFDAGTNEPISSYCFGSPDLICNVVENSGGLMFVQVGEVDKFPKPSGNRFVTGDAREVFTFVIAKP